MKKSEILQEFPKCDRHKVSKRGWKNGADKLARCRVATNLQSVKTKTSARCNKVKCIKMRYVCNCSKRAPKHAFVVKQTNKQTRQNLIRDLGVLD